MPDAPKNPDGYKELGAEEITPELKSFVNQLDGDVRAEKTNRATWENYIDRYRNLRYGVRNIKTTPWPNCANYVVQIADSHINRLKPYYVNLAYGVSPICTFEPFGPEDMEAARKREVLFDWRMRSQVKFFDQYVYGVDRVLQDGAVIFKVIWRFETQTYIHVFDLDDYSQEELRVFFDTATDDAALFAILADESGANLEFEENVKEINKAVKAFRAGKYLIEMTLQEIKINRPQVIARDLREDIVIPIYTLMFEENLDNARFIDDRVWSNSNDILKAMEDGKYQKYDKSVVDSWKGKGLEGSRKYAASAQMKSNNDVLLHETCCWYDINDDGIEERCIVTYPDADPGRILRFIGLPYDHGQWPHTLVKRELNDPDVYSSRGIPAIDEDFQNGMSTALNQAIDHGTINTPKVVYKRGAISNVRNARYIPGEPVEIINGTVDDYQLRQAINTTQGPLFQQLQMLKSLADQRIGDLTAALTSPSGMPGAGQQGNRTKAEINLMENLQQGPQSMDLLVFQMQMARVYYQIDALYEQFGDEEEYQLIMNEKPVKIKRKEIMGRFNIIPNGRMDNTNPAQRAQKVFNLMRIFANDPDIRQYELKRLFISDYDFRLVSKVLLTEDQMAQRDAMMMKEHDAQKQGLKDELVQSRELQDALDVRKAYALSLVQGKPFAPG